MAGFRCRIKFQAWTNLYSCAEQAWFALGILVYFEKMVSQLDSIAVSLFVNNETAMLSSPSAFEDFKYFTLSCEGTQSYSFFGNNHDSAKIISILFELHVYVIVSSRHNFFSQVEVVMLSLTTIDASCHAWKFWTSAKSWFHIWEGDKKGRLGSALQRYSEQGNIPHYCWQSLFNRAANKADFWNKILYQ